MSAGAYCVLDIETRVSNEALLLLPKGGPRATIERVALQEVVAAATLTFTVDEAGAFGAFDLRSDWSDEIGEAVLLERLGSRLDPVYRADGAVVSFNGSHDLSVLRRRCGRHWLFGTCDWPDWARAGAGRHRDMMLENRFGGARMPSLVDACAGYGIDASARAAAGVTANTPDAVRKCELDVVATAILLFHGLSFDAGSPLPLMRGWTAMAAALLPGLRKRAHLAPLLCDPSVTEANDTLRRAVGVVLTPCG